MEPVGDPLSSNMNTLPSNEETGCKPKNLAGDKEDDNNN